MKSVKCLSLFAVLALVGCGDGGTTKEDPIVINNDTNAQVVVNNTTTTTPNNTTAPANVSPNNVSNSCGDGVLDPDEACDDSNRADKDGCSSVCEIETVVLRNLEAVLETGSAEDRCEEFSCRADYKLTLTLQNFTDMEVDRVTNIRMTLGGLEFSTGGVTCTDPAWLVFPDSRSEIIDILVEYDSPSYRMRTPCNEFSPEFVSVSAEVVPYPADGQVSFEITGLLEDGSVWATEGTTDLKDLR